MVKEFKGKKTYGKQNLIKEIVYVSRPDGKAAFTKGELLNDGCDPHDIRRATVLLDCTKQQFIQKLKGDCVECGHNFFTDSPTYYGNVWVKVKDDGSLVLFNKKRNTAPEFLIFTYTAGYVPAKLPQVVHLENNQRGVLFRGHTMRPDVWGFADHGEKIFFVDKEYADKVAPGLAVVSRILFEKENYGFVSAEMVHMTRPAATKLTGYFLSQKYMSGECCIRFMRHSKIGEYVLLEGYPSMFETTVLYSDVTGDVHTLSLSHVDGSQKTYEDGTEIAAYTVNDFVCEQRIGCLAGDIVQWQVQPAFCGMVEQVYDGYSSEPVERARNSGWVTFYQFDRLVYVKYDERKLFRAAAALTEDEFNQVLDTCNKINEEFERAVKSRIKKGKLHMAGAL